MRLGMSQGKKLECGNECVWSMWCPGVDLALTWRAVLCEVQGGCSSDESRMTWRSPWRANKKTRTENVRSQMNAREDFTW